MTMDGQRQSTRPGPPASRLVCGSSSPSRAEQLEEAALESAERYMDVAA